MDDPITVTQVRAAINRHQFRHANEEELEAGIAFVLGELGLPVDRQVRLDEHSRIDLVTYLPRPAADPIRLGIEVKIAGKPGDVRRQVQRYAEFDTLGALLLVTTIYRHMIEVVGASLASADGGPAGARRLLSGKPFDTVLINRGLL